jgi:hypothetical protein
VDTQTLERLLIDRRLGELPPDSARLLDAYERLCPGVADLAAQLDATLDVARQAILSETTSRSAMPLLPSRMTNTGRSPTPRARKFAWAVAWGRRTAVAAIIALAFALGHFTGGGKAREGGPIMAIAHATAGTAAQPETATTSGAFWSLERIKKAAGDRAPEARPQVIWSSPLGPPQIGGNT